MKMRRFVWLCLVMVWMWFFVATPLIANAQPVNVAVENARQKMEAAAGGPVEMTTSSSTGLATFLAAPPGKQIPSLVPSTASPEDRGWGVLQTYGEAFGITAREQLQVERVEGPDEVGMEHVRYRQVHRGVPVTGGEVIVHLRGADVTAVTAKTLPDLDAVGTTPTVTPEEALAAAQAVLAKHLNVTDAKLSTPRLEIFNRGVLEGRQYPTRLAWFIEATKTDVREFIWVDAERGAVLLHFSQLADARVRRIYDANNLSTLPGTLVRSEGQAPTGDADVDKAYDYSGDTYDYFFYHHMRDSYNNAGAALISTVDYCPPGGPCPYPNAFWNGAQMVYGDGYASADDVVAHELTHAVTERSANLVYYMQSGALNESFSDIFGETVDLTNGRGTDTAAVRWLMGEDLPVGAIRNMMNPNAFGDPGKVSDPQFICNDPGLDRGGVHINSGVANHAYALMADGGTYNGQTVTAIGVKKAWKIQYRVLTMYLVATSDFQAYYTAVQQACTDLLGVVGITSADCLQVKKALDAVEMYSATCSPADTPALCPAGQILQNLFFDNLENIASGRWITTTGSGSNHWANHVSAWCDGTPPANVYCTGFSTSGDHMFWGFNHGDIGDSSVEMTSNVAIPAGTVRMQFNHSYNFENIHSDGGVIEYSTNNGTTWIDAGPLRAAGANYGGIISYCCGNPLAGRNAFVNNSLGYTATQLNLASLAGQNVRFRFRMGTDESGADRGWFIDDVRIYRCAAASELRIDDVTGAEGNAGTTAFTFTVTLTPASTGTVTVRYATSNGTALAGSDYTGTTGTLTFTAGQTSKTVTVSVLGNTLFEPNETFFVLLSDPTGATIADGKGLGIILNDDLPRLSINDVTKAEGNSGATAYTFTVTLSPASAGTVTVNYATANGTALAGSDYTAASGTLTFTAGQTSKTVTVNVLGDTAVELNETFFVNLSGAVGATIGHSQGVGTITNDDIATLRINDMTLTEGNSDAKAFNFTVTMSDPSSTNVAVNYGTANGTALAGSDYTAASGTLTFTPGQTSRTVTVNVLGDTAVEPNETFFVNLSGAVGATIADSQGLGTIINDDGPVLHINDVSRAEGNAGTTAFTFTVTLTPASTGTVTVRYATANGTALAGSDYTAASGTLTFTAGQTSKTVTVNVLGNTVFEPNETFFVNLSGAVGATIADSQGLGTIINDDGHVLRINDVRLAEGNAGTTAFTFTVTLSAASTGTVTVNYATANGTALALSDYITARGTLTFTLGQTTKTVRVSVLGNTLVEPNETFFVNLTNAVGATIFDSQGMGTIVNDD